jgi:diguanylate cyclase
MSQDRSAARAMQIASAALAHMKIEGVPPTPENYMLWFYYFEGSKPELKKVLEAERSAKNGISEHRSELIFNRFFNSGRNEPDPGPMLEWSSRMEQTASQILRSLAETGEDTRNYGRTLGNFAGEIAGSRDVGEIRGLVGSLINETKTMTSQIDRLQGEVSSSAREISDLRKELDNTKRDAFTDGLTGLANRKCFDATLARVLTECSEAGEPATLILADLDNFKSFNDHHGHQVGDQVLRLVGRTLINCVKGQDTAARFGGEEFAVVLPNTGLAGGVALAETIRKTIASKKLVRKGSDAELGAITLSLGVAEVAPDEAVDSLIRRADQALYAAKRGGRNRVVATNAATSPGVAHAKRA